MRTIAVIALASLPSLALAQPSVFVDCSGASISSLSTNPPDIVRTSTGTIDAAPGYTFSFNPIVRGTGFLGIIIIPADTPLGDVLNGFLPGSQRTLYGAVRNPGASVPVTLDSETIAGTFSGLNISLTFEQSILADRRGQSAIRNIQKPFGLGINVVSGGGLFNTFTPPPAQITELHLDGDLLSVRQSGLAPASGPGRARYLDDSAFGPILGGPGQENIYPNPPTPQNVTQSQSAFGTTASFGLPPINGEDDTVYRVSPPRNLADPTNQAKSRGIGIAFWPNTRDYWPEDRNGQWTLVWDILIPASSWSSEFAACLLEDNHNNDSSADAWIRVVNGQTVFGYQVPFANYIPLPGVQPGQWFRLALSSDGYRTKVGRVFVNGSLAGTTSGDWVYASTKSTDPRWGDVSSANPQGTPVAPATWNGWGQFPSPWAQAPNSTLAPMASTVCFFSDLQGRGETFYLANLLYTDEAMTDAQITALGGPNARGVVYLRPLPPSCDPDVNCDGAINGFDIEATEQAVNGDFSNFCQSSADLNGDGAENGFDIETEEQWVNGAPC
ncbi:hypothetical protein PHYC_03377 [Phycisphaerales bacterium]|nr:hypothetical protein PHYC_03377 [Phycisphaerales bacterium]